MFATKLEIMATRGFGDAGLSARTWMVRDRFISWHRDCELRRHIDSLLPGYANAGYYGPVPSVGPF